jgi:hypothetical protein
MSSGKRVSASRMEKNEIKRFVLNSVEHGGREIFQRGASEQNNRDLRGFSRM